MNRIVRVGILAGLAVIGVGVASGTAAADRTGIIHGYTACQDAAHSYQSAGYWANCQLLQGDSYIVEYHKSGGNGLPSTGSFGS